MLVLLARCKRIIYKKGFKVIDILLGTDYYWTYIFHSNGLYRSDYQFCKEQIGFIHLPKTGGTSFSKLLSKDAAHRFKNANIHRAVSRYCPPSEYKYVTILRDTTARVWSQYQMVLRSSEDYPYYKYAQQGLKSFLENCWAVRSMACRQYSGDMYSEPSIETMEKAFKNLKDFYAIINFDNLVVEATTFLEAHKIEVNTLPHERKAKYPKPSEAEVALIKKFNRYDIILMERWKESKMGNL